MGNDFRTVNLHSTKNERVLPAWLAGYLRIQSRLIGDRNYFLDFYWIPEATARGLFELFIIISEYLFFIATRWVPIDYFRDSMIGEGNRWRPLRPIRCLAFLCTIRSELVCKAFYGGWCGVGRGFHSMMYLLGFLRWILVNNFYILLSYECILNFYF